MAGRLTRRDIVLRAAASAVALASPVRAGETHEVQIQAFAFSPKVVTARIGDTIRWVNHDLAPHTATADEFGWDTGELVLNEAGEITVQQGMETSYFCAYHPHMKGRIEILG